MSDAEAVDDGKWHTVELKWMQGELWLNLDYGLHEKTVAVESRLQGLHVDKVSVGGLETAGSEPANIIPFIGCIKVMRDCTSDCDWFNVTCANDDALVWSGCQTGQPEEWMDAIRR